MGKKRIFIDRAKWRTGGDAGDRVAQFGRTDLRNTLGYCCCLGFIVAQTRPEIPILGIEDPEDCRCTIEGLTYEVASELTILGIEDQEKVAGRIRNTKLVWAAIRINDEATLTNAQREQQLLELFEDSPYELEFVGEYNEQD